jgi:hypothetical protein
MTPWKNINVSLHIPKNTRESDHFIDKSGTKKICLKMNIENEN